MSLLPSGPKPEPQAIHQNQTDPLRQILSSYAGTHLALGKDAPLGRAVQRTGVVVAIPTLLGYTTITFGYDFWKAQV
jgi:hypothetical protein